MTDEQIAALGKARHHLACNLALALHKTLGPTDAAWLAADVARCVSACNALIAVENAAGAKITPLPEDEK